MCASGCGYEVVDEADNAIVQKVRSGEFELVKKDELTVLRHDADLGKHTGRYQIYKNGFRTWRLDTATGDTCILLTSEEDWKSPKTNASGCH
jgi:hypothetical protein